MSTGYTGYSVISHDLMESYFWHFHGGKSAVTLGTSALI